MARLPYTVKLIPAPDDTRFTHDVPLDVPLALKVGCKVHVQVRGGVCTTSLSPKLLFINMTSTYMVLRMKCHG